MWPWLWLAIVILAALPWALWCGGRRGSGGSSALVICLCLSISLGCLTLLMFGFGVFGISLRLWVINLPYFAAMAIGGRLIWRDRAQLAPLRLWPETWERRSIWLMCAAIAIAQLINASYWPFFRDDAQGIYAPYAVEIYETRALVSLKGKADIASRYDSYPMMMPLAYAYAYMSAGVEQEYLAKTLATLLAIATMPAAYLLGRSAHSESVGWLAAGLLALTPAFWRWASAGYVDLPMAFFYTMVGYFVLRLWRSGRTSDAFLTGLHFGLACWVKNAGLVAAPLLAVWLVLACFRGSVRWRQVFRCWPRGFLRRVGMVCLDVLAGWRHRSAHCLDRAGTTLARNAIHIRAAMERLCLRGLADHDRAGLYAVEILAKRFGCSRLRIIITLGVTILVGLVVVRQL